MNAKLPPLPPVDGLWNRRRARDLCHPAPTVEADAINLVVVELFSAHRELVSLAVLEQGRPIGLINRNIFMSQMSRPFHRELYDRKSCIAFMDKQPLVVDGDLSVEALTFKAVESGEKALADGFIVTHQGCFIGLGNGLQLMAVVAEMQAEKNRQMMQSLEYASVIQRAMLRASRDSLATTLDDAALLWAPRDVVGGDFYHFASHVDGWFGAIADCTGHGVPGAFMTLIAASALTQALAQLGPRQPGALLAAVNRSVKHQLGQEQSTAGACESDDGLDAAFFWYDRACQTLTFAGARIALHVLRADGSGFESIPGQRMGVGYVDTPLDQQWTDVNVAVPNDSLLFICTDGLTDQIGGPKRIAFGRRRALDLLVQARHQPAHALGEALQAALSAWQGEQVRRDDLTLFCARLKERHP